MGLAGRVCDCTSANLYIYTFYCRSTCSKKEAVTLSRHYFLNSTFVIIDVLVSLMLIHLHRHSFSYTGMYALGHPGC